MHTEDLYARIIDHLGEGIYFVDKDRKILVWNDAAQKITGYTKEEVVGQYCYDHILDDIDKEGNQLCQGGCPMSAAMSSGIPVKIEVVLKHKKGYRIPAVVKSIPVFEEDEIIGAVQIFTYNSDKDNKNEIVNSLTKLVMTDRLTGLSNKKHTETILESKFKEYKRFGVSFSVLYMNLDNFSACNTENGYEAGNEMLIAIAQSLRHSVRDTDFVGRWSGDNFLGVFETKSVDVLKAVAEKVRVIIENTRVEIDGKSIHVTASIGATAVLGDDTPQHIIHRADSLMNVSKISGKNCSTVG